MKTTFLKRISSVLLILAVLFSACACGGSGSTGLNNGYNNNYNNDYNNNSNDPSIQTTEAADTDINVDPIETSASTESETEPPKQEEPPVNAVVKATELSDPDLRYVMIYNPKIYDENSASDLSSLTLGYLGNQIDIDSNRGDGLEDEEGESYSQIPQNDWLKYFPDDVNIEGDRADPMGTDYAKGDVKKFYVSADGNLPNRPEQEFVCAYAGKHCYIWSIAGKLSQTSIDELGAEFDNKIYTAVTDRFGTPRFVGESGKVNILLYGMSGGLLGYFALPDLFTPAELPQVGLDGVTCNTGHAIININSNLLQGTSAYKELVYSTMAHELQHCVNFSATFNTTNFAIMNTWLNESMSGYIEAELYANSKDLSDHYGSFNSSAAIRNGQSLYNFDSVYPDIGVYGSVYHFSKYMESISGKTIYSSIMEYWRESYSRTLTVSEAIAKSTSKTVYNDIDGSIDYSNLSIQFDSANDEWMSKLTLNFYLSCLSNDRNITTFKKIDRSSLLYDNISKAEIEGGGRIIVALSGSTFTIPSGSDQGLIYVGLDKDFKPITQFVCQ